MLQNVDINRLSSSDPYEELSAQEKRRRTLKKKKRAKEVRELWINSNTGKRQEWQSKEQKSYDFFLNSQLTQEEKDMLEDAGMPTFIINRVTPIIETMKYFVTAGSPRWKAVGVEGSDADIAKIHTDVIDYSWYISNGKSVFSQVVLDSLVKSKGFFHVVVDPDADRGMGEVKFERVDPFHVYTATQASDLFDRDATYMMIKKDIPKEQLIEMLPKYKTTIMAAQGEEGGSAYTERDLEDSDSIQPEDMELQVKTKDAAPDDVLPYYELYEKVSQSFYNVFLRIPPSNRELNEAKRAIDQTLKEFAKELEVQYGETEKALEEALTKGEITRERFKWELEKEAKRIENEIGSRRQMMYNVVEEEAGKIVQKIVTEEEFEEVKKADKGEVIRAVPYFEPRIKKTVVAGDRVLYEDIMNITQYPLVPIPYTHTGTVCPMSAVTPLVGKQQEINKAHQIMIHNANLSSNVRWKYVEGEIDVNLWERYNASPGALLPYRPGFSNEGPKEVLPQNINNAFFTIEQDSKGDMEYIAGIQPPSMGISTSKEETYRGFLAKDEYGTRRIKSWVQNIVEPALEHLGRVFTEMAQDTYTIHKVFRIVEPNPAGGFDERRVEINKPIYNRFGDEMARFNDYGSTKYDIRIVAGSTLPLNRWALLEEYKQWLQIGVIDDITFLEQTDIPNKEKVIERKSMIAQLQQQLDQMEEALKDRDGTIETLSRQLVQAGIRDRIREADKEVDRSKTEGKMKQKLYGERLKDLVENTKKEAKMAQQTKKSEK